jgi:hypothetical protein
MAPGFLREARPIASAMQSSRYVPLAAFLSFHREDMMEP